MKRGDCEFLHSKNVMACKWMDNQSVLLVSTALEGMYDVSSVQRKKRICDKICYPCPTVVNLFIQNWHGWGWSYGSTNWSISVRSQIICSFLSVHFLWFVIFPSVNSFLVCNMKHPKQLTLLDYKIVIAKNLIRWHQSRQRVVPFSRPSKRKSISVESNDHGDHLP